MEKITKETTLGKILERANVERILEKFEIPCLHCPMARFEMENLKIGEVCKMYGIDANKLIKELNEQRH